MKELLKESDFIFYRDNNKNIQVRLMLGNETVWSTQRGMAEIFGVEIPAISKHISNVYDEGELNKDRTISKIEIVQKEGDRDISRNIDFYNLDMIIAVGYRVNSYQATQFRIWATNILKEYLIKGFVLDDERLKQGAKAFGKDYFNALTESIRDIPVSERRLYTSQRR